MPSLPGVPRRGPLLVAFLVGLLSGAGLMALLSPAPEPAAPQTSSTTTSHPQTEQLPAQHTPAAAQLERQLLACQVEQLDKDDELTAARAELAELREQLAGARSEAARYRQGLDRAVDTLNRRPAGPAPRSPAPAQPAGRLASLSGPYVAIEGATLVASGKVWNSGGGTARGHLSVGLLADGRVVETGRLEVTVGAGADRAWTYRFRYPPREGVQYAAELRIQGR